MPQIRYYHHGRYYRPARQLPLLPPLSLVPAVDPSKHHQIRLGHPSGDYHDVNRRWKSRRDKEFRWMIRYIGENLTGENIADLRFLCRDHVHPPDILRETMSGAKLMTILENQRLVAENSLFFLQTVLYYIARPDLYQLVHDFRTKRQDDHKKLGVEILYDTTNRDGKGLALTKELKSFRRKLKPRSRFNAVDIPAMMKRLSELKTQMHSQLPKTIDRSYADSVLSVSQSNASDSEWEDVDTDDEVDGDDVTTTDDVIDHSEITATSNLKSRRTTDGRNKTCADSGNHGKPILPNITKKTLEVNVKMGRDGESACDTETESEYETVDDADNDSKGEGFGNSISSSSPGRILGPSKPVHNFTHRSSEFSDMLINGTQAYNDDDVIACVRDVNKNKSALSVKTNGNDTRDNPIEQEQDTIIPRPKVPLKIRVLRKKMRRDSPSRKLKRSVAAVKNVKRSKFLPQLKAAEQSGSLHELKTTRRLPTHEPQRINFLPDIYDKYARKSVSSTASTKTASSRKSKKK